MLSLFFLVKTDETPESGVLTHTKNDIGFPGLTRVLVWPGVGAVGPGGDGSKAAEGEAALETDRVYN